MKKLQLIINNVFILLLLVTLSCLKAQQDKILLTIDNTPITLSEFQYMFSKNYSISNSEKNPDEYLQSFINYKLKVIEAHKLGYDTMKSFIEELRTYRDQLAEKYLTKQSVRDSLVKEAYDRTIKEINASHIMIRLSTDATPSDTLIAYNKILKLRERILKGEKFEDIAINYSEDPSVTRNKGNLGWFHAFRMIYPFECVAYTTPVNEISMPFRTNFGYHIIKVNGIRPSKGLIKLAHILVYGDEKNSDARKNAEEKINECYKKLLEGFSFEELAKEYSEDEYTAPYGGELDWYESGVIPPDIEEIVFNLKEIGDISKIVPTAYGFHIFKLLGKKTFDNFENLKKELENKVDRDNYRKKVIEEQSLALIRKENNCRIYKDNMYQLVDIMDSTIYDGTWNYELAYNMLDVIVSFDNKDYTQKDYAEFLSKKAPFNKKLTYNDILNLYFNDFLNYVTKEYEKNNLEKKYTEFKNIMKEYYDGILLFNLTNDSIWNKAMQDSLGLLSFYNKNKKNYLWKDRAQVIYFEIPDTLFKKFNSKFVIKKLTQKNKEELHKIFCQNDSIECIKHQINFIEIDDFKEKYPSLNFKTKSYQINNQNNKVFILLVKKIIKSQPKKFEESKGLVIADYQNYLEDQWIKRLRNKYTININYDVLNEFKNSLKN